MNTPAPVSYQIRMKPEDGKVWTDATEPADLEQTTARLEQSQPWPGYTFAIFPVLMGDAGQPLTLATK